MTVSNALKAISETPDELRVGNYIVLFNGRDLTGQTLPNGRIVNGLNADGSKGEYFTKATKLDSSYTDTGVLHVDWEHGEVYGDGDPGPGEVLGYVDWKTKAVDERGVFVERVLSRRNKYIKWVTPLIKAGLVGTSSEAIPDKVRVKANGEIAEWPLKADTLTVTPFDWRMLDDNSLAAVKALKALGVQFKVEGISKAVTAGQPDSDGSTAQSQQVKDRPMIKPFDLNGQYYAFETDEQGNAVGTTPEEAKGGPYATPEECIKACEELNAQPAADPNAPPAQGQPPPAKPNPVGAKPPMKSIPSKGEPMSDELVTKVAEQEKVIEKLQGDVKTMKAIIEAPRVPVPGGSAEVRDPKGPFKSLGEQLMAIKDLALGRGNTEVAHNKLKAVQEHLKALGANEQTGADGGFALQSEFSLEALSRVYGTGEIMKRVQKRTVGAGFNGLKVNVINETSRINGSRFGGVQAYWLNEAGTKTSSRPTMRLFDLPLEKLIGLYYATDEVLQDVVALESDVSEAFSAEIQFKAEDAIFNGTGAGTPAGVVGHAATVSIAKESGQAAATVLYKNLSNMYARLWAGDRDGAAWFINQDVTPTLDDLYQVVGTAGIPPYFITYSPEGIMKIKGLPVITVEYAQAVGTVGDIVLGNFRNYRWADKGGTKSDSSIHVAFLTDETTFRWVYRCNGKPFDIAPLTPKNGTKTLAHFVTLDTR